MEEVKRWFVEFITSPVFAASCLAGFIWLFKAVLGRALDKRVESHKLEGQRQTEQLKAEWQQHTERLKAEWQVQAEASPHMTPKTSRKMGCSRSNWAKSSISGRS